MDAVCEAREKKTKGGKIEGKKEEIKENGVKEDNGKDDDEVETDKSTVCYLLLLFPVIHSIYWSFLASTAF